MKRLNLISTIVLGGLLGVSANAETVVFDTSLVTPDGSAATDTAGSDNPSYYNGTGNQEVQGGWTVATGNNLTSDASSIVEIGLRAKLAFANSVIDTPNDDYTVPTGTFINNGHLHDMWNYEFSIDLNPGAGTNTLNLSGVTAQITITDANNIANTISYNFLSLPDNVGVGAGDTTTLTGSPLQADGAVGTDWGAQNSENPTFGGFGALTYDPNAASAWNIQLDLYQGTGAGAVNANNLIATDDIEVNVVTPEPSTWLLLAAGGLVLFLLQRRRQSVA